MASDEFDISEDADEGGPQVAEETHVIAPEQAVAAVLIRRLLTEQPEVGRIAAECGICISVTVPAADWAHPVAAAWLDVAWHARHYASGSDRLQEEYLLPARRSDQRSGKAQAPCVAFVRHESRKDAKPDAANAVVRSALSRGRAVIGFSQTPSRHLPPDLLLVADAQLVLPQPDVSALLEAAAEISGVQPTVGFPADLACHVTVADFRLARRPGESADAWLDRLRVLAQRRAEVVAIQVGPDLDQLGGMDEAVAIGKAIAQDLADYAASRIPWSMVAPGVLLVGEPGVGKTLFAKALSRTARVPLVCGSLAEWQAHKDGHLGDLLRAMRECFERAIRVSPCLLFIDEIDGFGNRSTFEHRYRDYSIQVVNGLLELLDGVAGREGVVVIAACNSPERLDPGIVRSGRLDRVVNVPLPTRDGMIRILRYHLGDDLAEMDITPVALEALGSSSADAARAVRDGRRLARQKCRPFAAADLMQAVKDLFPGRKLTSEHQWTNAIHEAGHALILSRDAPDSVTRVSIRTAAAIGGSVMTDLAELGPLTRPCIDRMLQGLLAGRAAEQAVLHRVSAGAGGGADSDLARATWLAAAAFGAFGLGDAEDGLVWLGLISPAKLPRFLQLRPLLAQRIGAKLSSVYADVLGYLRLNCHVVEHIARALLDRGVLDGAELAALIAEARQQDGTSADLADEDSAVRQR